MGKQIAEFSWKIVEIIQSVKSNPEQTLAVLRILIDRLFSVTDNKPNLDAFKFFTGILHVINQRYPLMKEIMIAKIFAESNGLALLVNPYSQYKSLKEYYTHAGYKFTDGGKNRETLDKLFSDRLSRYLQFLMHICNLDIKFHLPFLWNYLQAAIANPINEFTPLIIRIILEHAGKHFKEAYKKKFENLLLFIKKDHNEWERKMNQGANFKKVPNDDFVNRMYDY